MGTHYQSYETNHLDQNIFLTFLVVVVGVKTTKLFNLLPELTNESSAPMRATLTNGGLSDVWVLQNF
jgi:hypothetical protein